jgi:hypothetical protein
VTVDTTWIVQNEFQTFEAIYGNTNGEVWHACYELTSDFRIKEFKELSKVKLVGCDPEGNRISKVKILRQRRSTTVLIAIK